MLEKKTDGRVVDRLWLSKWFEHTQGYELDEWKGEWKERGAESVTHIFQNGDVDKQRNIQGVEGCERTENKKQVIGQTMTVSNETAKATGEEITAQVLNQTTRNRVSLKARESTID